ncbi:hypothetical protein FHR99_002080 [Litorivivens lipolytica]|uniref:DUF1214 domain-containing protein n=1 Tax=Litorivivens lipolytica TaxID=1524264 RepID=A0A7W4W5I1_9GAMM|nr:DUF1214 domain-containing protein [Litorivivens lipolytica]MBB3047814.1 hypothetical protein [Litorivivens lipolytica]
MTVQTASRSALRDLINLLEEIDERWAGPEWNLHSPEDVAAAHRSLMHVLEGGLATMFENDVAYPQFRRIVTPWRKFTGDNGDAIYFDAPVSADYEYRVRGQINGAVYVSITVEMGTEDGSMASKTAGVINDTQFDVDANGWFELRLGGEPAERNWLPLPEGASRITTRHYFEHKQCGAGDPALEPALYIDAINPERAPAVPNDQSIAEGIKRVAGFVRSRTLGMPPMANVEKQPAFVALTPNQFPKPVVPGDFGLSAFDAHYSMAPYYLEPHQALVITGRWPICRFGSLDLWTRHQQTYDYCNRTVSLNRAQTQLEPDGSFKMILAHEDPGLPNWIDTEGRVLGLMFWRFFLVEGEVETPQAEVVELASLR